MAKENKRESILDAAERILEHHAYSDLSFDRLVKESGISKGGLLYHFPTKESFFSALVDRLIQGFDDEYDRQVKKGHFDFKKTLSSISTSPRMASAARGLMAAISHDPNLAAPLRKAYERWDKDTFAQFYDTQEAWKFRLFFDGLFFCILLDLPRPSKKELKSIVETFRTKLKA